MSTAIAREAPPRPEPVSLRRKGVRPADLVFKLALQACLFIAFAFLVSLLVFVIVKALPRLDSRLWTGMPSSRQAGADRAGVQSAIYGTIWVIGLTALLCLPTGIAAAVYLEEYADNTRWYNRFLELNIQNLAGVPSIVFGILGLGIIARVLGFGFTVTTAAITLALLVLPVVIIASREAIRAVPASIRQGSYALGATRWQTTYRQVLPAAIPGIATGSILALSRAMGEAAPLLLLGAATLIRFNPDGLDSGYTVLPIQIFNFIKSPFEAYQQLGAATIVLLLVILLIMNSAAIYIRNRFQRRT